MQEHSDAELLREYAQHGDEAAFREIVQRHADFVYSAALRQTESPDQARDVTQTVFTDLARKAATLSQRLSPQSSLAGWLYRSTRFAVLKSLRADRRRLAYETQAMEHLATPAEPAPDWENVRPFLDEAMSSLSDEDRDALLLRFFKNHDFRAVGHAFGISDDAAQKRVSRALEKLREQLSRRGIQTSAAALSLVITVNAVQAAPIGLAAAVSSAALLPGAGVSTGLTATKILAMTTLQKTLIATTIAVAVGAGLYERSQASRLRTTVETLQQQQAPIAEQIAQLTRARDDANALLAAVRDENARLRENASDLPRLRAKLAQLENDSRDFSKLKSTIADDKTLTSVVSWKQRVDQLRARLDQTPESRIPELQLVTEEDWLNAARGKLETDIDYRKALSTLRGAAENKVALMLQNALKSYLKQNGDAVPTELSQLKPFLPPNTDDALFQRWEIAPASTIKSLGLGGDTIITERSAVDDVFDLRHGIGPFGMGTTDFLSSETREIISPLWKAFTADHSGHEPDEVAQLMPYASTPEQQAAVQKMVLKHNADSK
jgi:RNA polymerase sigma factor (sigma-70 family)